MKTNRYEVYRSLESSMLGIKDYKDMPVIDNGEHLVPIIGTANLTSKQRGEDMKEYTGDSVYVRQGVIDKLGQAATLLVEADNELSLNVTYGYRALQVQTRNFEKAKRSFTDQYEGEALDIAAHRLTARPDVAGHPTGGAVDIEITRQAEPI
jgi:D-alanyl-D-alanine dipeptidase